MTAGRAMRGERRVVVTGMGAVTPIGNDVATFWEGLIAGRSGIERITSFDPSSVDSKVAGEIRDFDADEVMPKKEVRRNDRYVHYAWAAAAEAMRDAGLDNPISDEALAERTGVIVGSGIGGINTMIRDVIEAHDLGIERVGPFLVTALIADMGAGYIAIYANARGPNYATVSACSSSNHAIGDALNIIRRGEAHVAKTLWPAHHGGDLDRDIDAGDGPAGSQHDLGHGRDGVIELGQRGGDPERIVRHRDDLDPGLVRGDRGEPHAVGATGLVQVIQQRAFVGSGMHRHRPAERAHNAFVEQRLRNRVLLPLRKYRIGMTMACERFGRPYQRFSGSRPRPHISTCRN